MSTKTFFKRISLGVVVALGFGFLSAPSSQAVRLTTSLTLSSATGTANVNDTASVTLTLRASGNTSANDSAGANADTFTIRYTCDAPTGASCPAIQMYQSQAADTANVTVQNRAIANSLPGWVNIGSTAANGWTESLSSSTSTGRSVIAAKAVTFAAAGTYTYSFYVNGGGVNDVITGTSAAGTTYSTWTVTVTAPATNVTGGSATVYISEDTLTASINHSQWLTRSATDSAIVAAKGSAATPKPVGYAYLRLANASGETRVAVGSGFNPVQDSVTVSVSGPGMVWAGDVTGAWSPAKSTTMSVSNTASYVSETLVIYNDGTAGTMTITFSKGATTLATKTVTFYGDPASATGVSLSDTYTFYHGTARSITLTAAIKDSGSNALSAGTLYVFSSDTAIAGAVPTTAVFGQTGHVCSTFTGSTAATYRLSCSVTVRDTGTVTLTVGDSWTVAGSTFTSTAVTLTIGGAQINTATVAFDKATYKPGEAAVITITASDIAGRNFGSNGTTGLANAFAKAVFTPSVSYSTQDAGTQGTSPTGTSFVNLNDGAVETRVVIMPSYEGDVKFELSYQTRNAASGTLTVASATAKVVDPSVAAQNAAIANAQAAADAATDAALQAIDAANAATDAANLAAEAADAATVAAQESKDSADAATAAVESLATQVATLMAALQAQITSLANVVAKIAKKVKA